MSMSSLAYARRAYKSFSRSARHLLQLIAGHQNLQTGWAYLSYRCLSEESGLTPPTSYAASGIVWKPTAP